MAASPPRRLVVLLQSPHGVRGFEQEMQGPSKSEEERKNKEMFLLDILSVGSEG